MTVIEKVSNFLRYWSQNPDGHWRLADNTPQLFREFRQTLPPETDLDVLHAALIAIVTRVPASPPYLVGLKTWVRNFQGSEGFCDEVLARPTKGKLITFQGVLAKAWIAYNLSLIDKVYKFFS